MSSNTKDVEKNVFVSGIFNVLHPGHIRLFKFAAEQGTRLIVGVKKYADDESDIFPYEERIQALESISLVDQIVAFDDLKTCLSSLKPQIVVKGSEFKKKYNPELDMIRDWNGRVIFSSGASQFSSRIFVKNGASIPSLDLPESYRRFIKHYNINGDSIKTSLARIHDMRVAVIGDVILDEYVDCDPVGLSREDPTIVVKPINNKMFVGGAAIVSEHARSFGAKVDFYSVVGSDDKADWIEAHLDNQGVNTFLFKDDSRPTTVKRRYRSENKTLLRVNEYRSHGLDEKLEQTFLDTFSANLDAYDLIIFSDFSYGLLNFETVEKLKKLAQRKGVTFVADSQTSSQRGDLGKFSGAGLVTPTEIEARLAANILEEDIGLAVVIERLSTKLQCPNVIITLGADGALILDFSNDRKPILGSLPALNKNPKDVSGAGDLLLITTSLLRKCGCDIWHSALVGMFASAIHISRVGNTPISQSELIKQIDKI